MLESYTAHAKETFAQARELVGSHDKAVRRSAGRFEKHGVFVEFADESDIVAKLKSLLKVEIATYIEEEESRLKEYILQYESDIIDFVRRTPLRITDWMLNSPLAQMKDEISGTIERILSITPIGIAGVLAASRPYGEEVPEDRYPVQIHVEIEIDVVVRQYGFGHLMQTRAVVQPDMIDGDSPVTLERTASVQPQENTKTIKRTITVYATLDSEKEKQKILDGFRIERIV